MLMKKIFNVSVYDVDADTDDDRNNNREISFNTNNTVCDNNERASCDVCTLQFAHYDIHTIRCRNNNILPFYLP